MKRVYLLVFFLFISLCRVYAGISIVGNQDTAQVNLLNRQGFSIHLTDHEETIKKAQQALELAQKLDYKNGIAESYRILGIGEFYSNNTTSAIADYLNALSYFKRANNLLGQASVYNNIGNLYLDIDYDSSLEYLQKGLKMAQQLGNEKLTAKAYLNIGNVYLKKKNFSLSLEYYDKSRKLFDKINDPVSLILILQNTGVINYKLKQYDKATQLLLEANREAKNKDMNTSIGKIDLSLSSLYIERKMYAEAAKFLEEGIGYAQVTKDEDLVADFTYNLYELESGRKNYQQALTHLHSIYKRDSILQTGTLASDLTLMKKQQDQQEKQRENELIIEKQKNDRVKFWWAASCSGMLLIVIALLFGNVKRKAKTNARLTELNGEVSRQKDNLDRINHHLEEIIDERTRDLQIKNKKLSEYSSYLSHQIRGPIATLKGLMNLEKEGLVDQRECINMMDKCVSDIDDKIIDMTDILHDPKRTSF
ncbi:tetratricopeptide repeat protein [Mucilaginibacter sp. McL0603]|uniref:tetratricopeptide repeat protein n=1 Tax=Mucilaginibacter sp. McL0603 TaxID=3415670 RepID=UPI003CF3585C